jgi:ABC-type transporter Mla subunit MlaD
MEDNMADEKKDFLKRLNQYVSQLDQRIELEEDALNRLPEPASANNASAEDMIRSMREPVIRTIVSYQSIRGQLYELFPELREKANTKSQRQ